MIRYNYWSNFSSGRFSLPFYPMIAAMDRKKQQYRLIHGSKTKLAGGVKKKLKFNQHLRYLGI